MKRRVRWLSVAMEGLSLSALAKRMMEDAYSNTRASGFLIERATRAVIAGAFVERVDVENVVEDPFGKQLRFRYVEFRPVEFTLTIEPPQLELIDPPRSCKTFLARLGALSEHHVTVDPIVGDVAKWLAAIESRMGRAYVTSMAFADVALSGATSADFVVTGTPDVRKEAARLLEGRRATLTAMDVSWMDEADTLVACELFRSGAMFDDHGEETLSLLRSAVREAWLPPVDRLASE